MEWIRGDRIGHGSFATVDLAIPKTKTFHKSMAVKTCGARHSASLMHEKLILDELQECPQIISCFGDCFSFENGEKLYNVLLDYASGGSLCDKIRNSYDRKLSEIDVRGYTKLILKGIHFIHDKGFVHCDIKLENILLDEYGVVKIADFGLAKKAGEESGDWNLEGELLRGTPMYMSPEMATRGEQDFPADIWALGCAVVEMITGTSAWHCSNMAALVLKIGVGEEMPELPGNLSDEGKDFLKKCFVKDPKERWTAEMLLNHPFVNHIDHEDVFNIVSSREVIDLPSTSPKCPFELTLSPSSTLDFDFDSNWCGSGGDGGGSWFDSATKRLSRLASDQMPDWSTEDEWITVR